MALKIFDKKNRNQIYLGGIRPGHFGGVFNPSFALIWAVASLPLLGPSLKKNKHNFQQNPKKEFHLTSSAPSVWSLLSGKTVGSVVVDRLRDLP